MVRLLTTTFTYLLLSLATIPQTHAAGGACRGSANHGYCCPGTILRKDHSNSLDIADQICCKDEMPQGILLGSDSRTTCTSGSSIPLTQASYVGSGSAPATATATGSSGTISATGGASFDSALASILASASSSSSSSSSSTSFSGSATSTESMAAATSSGAAAAIGNALPLVGALGAAGGLALGL